MHYKDRREAGRILAQDLERLRGEPWHRTWNDCEVNLMSSYLAYHEGEWSSPSR